MAAALLRHHAGDYFEALSASTSQDPVAPEALDTLRHLGVACDGLRSKAPTEVEHLSFDFVITLCDKARREYEQAPHIGDLIAWDFEEPATRQCIHPYSKTAKELSERIKMFALVQTRNNRRIA